VLGSATCFNNIGDGPIEWLFLKKKKKLWSHPSLINRSMNRYDVLCKGYSPMPKMVTKSFVKRNFMPPMGRPKHALKVPCFLSF